MSKTTSSKSGKVAALAAEILTAEQIKEQFAEQIATGNVVVVQHKPRKRADGSKAIDIQLAQQSQAENLNATAKIRGIVIGGMRIAIINSVAIEQAEEFPIGTVLEDMKLVMIQHTSPEREIWETPDGWKMRTPSLVPDKDAEREDWDVACDINGNPIWTSMQVRGEGDSLVDERVERAKSMERSDFDDWRTKYFEDKGLEAFA